MGRQALKPDTTLWWGFSGAALGRKRSNAFVTSEASMRWKSTEEAKRSPSAVMAGASPAFMAVMTRSAMAGMMPLRTNCSIQRARRA